MTPWGFLFYQHNKLKGWKRVKDHFFSPNYSHTCIYSYIDSWTTDSKVFRNTELQLQTLKANPCHLQDLKPYMWICTDNMYICILTLDFFCVLLSFFGSEMLSSPAPSTLWPVSFLALWFSPSSDTCPTSTMSPWTKLPEMVWYCLSVLVK